MTAVLAIALGMGLAAAAGLRVFVPVLVAGIAAHFGYVSLNESFAWVSSTAALLAFGTAALVEVGAYYVPWLDHLLDVIATPTAVAAGILASAAVMVDLPPLVTWVVAIVGGGGVAGIVQMLSVATRVKSTLSTGGLANPVVATAETAGSVTVSVLAIVLPLVALVLVMIAVALLLRFTGRVLARRRAGRRAG